MPDQNKQTFKTLLSQNEDMINFITGHEDNIPYMYLDTKGNVTVGKGFMIPDVDSAGRYPFYYGTSSENLIKQANPHDIRDAYNKVKRKSYGQGVVAKSFNPFSSGSDLSKIGLNNDFIQQEIIRRLDASQKSLERKFRSFDQRPYPAQKALMDMEYNIGNPKFQHTIIDPSTGQNKPGWPKLFDALTNEDYAQAARQSHRKDVSEEQNKAIYDLFMEADRIKNDH